MSEKRILYQVAEFKIETEHRHADFLFWCPGCKCAHGIWTSQRNGLGAVWEFNGNLECPTFAPSLLLRYVAYPELDPATGDFARGADGKYVTGPDGRLQGARDMVCHSFIRNGRIEFLPDCTHEFAGRTVPMPEF